MLKQDVSSTLGGSLKNGLSVLSLIAREFDEQGLSNDDMVRLGSSDLKVIVDRSLGQIIAALRSRVRSVEALHVSDNRRSFEALLEAGLYDQHDPRITQEIFPYADAHTREIKIVYLLDLGHGDFDTALKSMGMLGFRPADIHNLLAVGAKYPIAQFRQPPIVALGSIVHDGRKLWVPVLESMDIGPARFLMLKEPPRYPGCKFLVVPNSLRPDIGHFTLNVAMQRAT